MRRVLTALLLLCLLTMASHRSAEGRQMVFPGNNPPGTWLYTLTSCGVPPCYIPSANGISAGYAGTWNPQIYNSAGTYTATVQAMQAGMDPTVTGSWVDIATTSGASVAIPFGPFAAMRIKVTACSGCNLSVSALVVED